MVGLCLKRSGLDEELQEHVEGECVYILHLHPYEITPTSPRSVSEPTAQGQPCYHPGKLRVG